jgi:glycosyltransferase involved in cell wall biosynthesis
MRPGFRFSRDHIFPSPSWNKRRIGAFYSKAWLTAELARDGPSLSLGCFLVCLEAIVRISVVITNFNYGDCVGRAIDSALAIEWPNKEVIVVDDGSTDHSHVVISGYGDRIKAVLKTNGGQNSAANVGFSKSTGDIVFFLDSDDTLAPDVARQVVPLFASTTAKVQFPLVTLRSDGSATGLYPRFPDAYSPSDVETSVAATGFYISSPTSGNAWALWALQKAFPLPTRWTKDVSANFFDGYLSAVASRLGRVVTVNEPLGTYFINPNNMWTKRFSPTLIAEACEEDLARAEYVNAKLSSLGLRPIEKRAFTEWMKRLVCRKYFRDGPVKEGWSALLPSSLYSAVADPGLPISTRILVMGWMVAVAVLPRRLALPVIKLRFVQGYRPRAMSWLLNKGQQLSKSSRGRASRVRV